MDNREVDWDSQNGLTKGKFYINSLVAFSGGVTASVGKQMTTDEIYFEL